MKSIRDFSDMELNEQIKNSRDDLEGAEYGTGVYNSALSELHVSIVEKQRREAIKGISYEEVEGEYER